MTDISFGVTNPLTPPDHRGRPHALRRVCVMALVGVILAGLPMAVMGWEGWMAQRTPGVNLENGHVWSGAVAEFYEASALATTWSRDSTSMYRLSTYYYLGHGVAPNNVDAFGWCLAAAKAHHPAAMNGVGVMYLMGIGVARDPQSALIWLNLAADAGNPDGSFNLGYVYADGNGVAVNRLKALEYFRRAEAGGDAIISASAKQAITIKHLENPAGP